MKRREFIARTSLISGGVVFLGHLSFAADVSAGFALSSSLTCTSPQVRHGYFRPREIRRILFPKWLRIFEKQHLTANGFEASNEDFEILMLEIEGQRVTIGIQGGKVYITTAQGVELLGIGIAELAVAKRKQMIVHCGDEPIHQRLKAEDICLCLRGETVLRSSSLHLNDITHIIDSQVVKVKPDSILLVLS